MGEDEFWHATPLYFAARQKAHSEQVRGQWERARLVAYYAAVAPRLDTRRPLRIRDVAQFAWDAETAPVFEKIDPEVIRKFNEESDAFMAQQQRPQA